jgi:hypothetical protein
MNHINVVDIQKHNMANKLQIGVVNGNNEVNELYNHEFNIYVDAGCFVIGDSEWFISHGANKELIHGVGKQIIKCTPGRYNIRYKVKHTWNGKQKGDTVIKIPSGELWITDACYVIRDEIWNKFLDDKRKFLDKDDISHIIVHTSGDGEFVCKLDLIKLSDINVK